MQLPTNEFMRYGEASREHLLAKVERLMDHRVPFIILPGNQVGPTLDFTQAEADMLETGWTLAIHRDYWPGVNEVLNG